MGSDLVVKLYDQRGDNDSPLFRPALLNVPIQIITQRAMEIDTHWSSLELKSSSYEWSPRHKTNADVREPRAKSRFDSVHQACEHHLRSETADGWAFRVLL